MPGSEQVWIDPPDDDDDDDPLLAENEVHVWLASLEQPHAVTLQLKQTLSPDELTMASPDCSINRGRRRPRFVTLSHLHDLALCAFIYIGSVGVDIEYMRADVATEQVARVTFLPASRRFCSTCPSKKGHARFTPAGRFERYSQVPHTRAHWS